MASSFDDIDGRQDGARSLRARASRGTIVSLLGQGGAQVLRLLGNLVLSRLLFPEAFGMMALVFLVVAALEQISNLGMQPAVIRHERGEEPVFLDTAWTIQLIRGAVLWLGAVAFAPAVADFYGEPQLASLIPVASIAAVLMGLSSTKLFVLTRRLALERRVAMDLIGQAVSLVCMIAFAWVYHSVWALVVGGLVNQGVRCLLSHVWIPGPRNRLRWDAHAARELLSFGKWVFVSSGISFLSSQIDIALLGRLVPAGVLGVYSIALMIPNLLRDLLGRLAATVLMPALSESNRESPEALRASYAAARRVILPAGLLAGLGAAVVAPAFFGFLYDDRYIDAGWIAQLALIRFWFAYLQGTSGQVLMAHGDARTWAISAAVATVGVTAGCLIGFEIAELPGVLIGAALGTVAGYLVMTMRLVRLRIASIVPELLYTALGTGLAFLVFGAASTAGILGVELNLGLRTLLFGALVVGPFAVWATLRTWREVRAS